MTQTIDPVKLKASAEHLEWALKQYPDSDDVQGLLHALGPLIENAKAGKVLVPVDRGEIPCGHNFADGIYRPYANPNVDEAYVMFSTELRGGLTEQDKQRHARMEAMRSPDKRGTQS